MFSSEAWLANPGANFYNGVATQSLRFDQSSSAFLHRTPSEAGNQQVWTFSTWYKLGSTFDSTLNIFTPHTGGDGSNESQMMIDYPNHAGKLRIYDSGGTRGDVQTSRIFRDPSAWYNIVISLDLTQATDTNRVKIYVNGVQETLAGTFPSQNTSWGWNGTSAHRISSYRGGTPFQDGYLSETIMVDGTQLAPTSFGETKNGVWIPKKYETKPSLIAQGTGTAIGDMTSGGGLAGAFNGTQFQSYASSAQQTSSQATSFIGKNWGSSKTVTGFILYSNTQFGFLGSGASTFTVKLYGKNGNPSNSTDGTLLFTSSAVTDANSRGSIRYFADTNIQSEETISSFNTTTAFTYHWVVITPNTSEGAYVSEIEFYEDASTYYGTNGFRLAFNSSDFNESGSAITDPYGSATDVPDDDVADASGSGNHFNVSGLVTSDFGMPDSPENNFATMNPLDNVGSILSEGNLKSASTSNSWKDVRSTFVMPTGSWYVELLSTSGIGNGNTGIGIVPQSNALPSNNFFGSQSNSWQYMSNGNWYNNNSIGGSGATFSANDIVGMSFDGSEVKFYKNNSLIHTVGSIPTDDYAIGISLYDTDESCILNFGQDSSFAGNKTSGSANAQDANDIGDFYYAPPSGFLALCTSNLPEPTIGPNSGTDEQAENYFGTLTYTGNGTDSNSTQNIRVGGTNVVGDIDFKPDWTWIKSRSNASNHILTDSVRLAGNVLFSNLINDEADNTAFFTSFETNGFNLAQNGGDTNANGYTYVAWNWKAGGAPTDSNSADAGEIPTAGSVKIDGVNKSDALSGSIPATKISANTTAGFSIVTYTGNGSAGATIGHALDALNKVPDALFIFNRDDDTEHPMTFPNIIGANKYLYIHATNKDDSFTNFFNNTNPTSSVFSVGSDNRTNGSSKNFVAYLFISIEGFSRFGSYEGNGATDGTFVYTGFRPAWILYKNIDASGDWELTDTVRNPNNDGSLVKLEPNNNGNDSARVMDILSNGFKFRNSSNSNTAHTYIYMAFAETPTKYSLAR